MNSVYVLIIWAVVWIIGYFFYAKWVDRRVWAVDPKRATPAKMYMDGVDFMPAKKTVLYGFQLNSIAGAAPILGPIIALQWGWLPAILWLCFGVFFIGWIHDYSSCMLSVRNDGQTFGALSYRLISPRARGILLTFIYFYLLLIAAVFALVGARGLSTNAALPLPMLVVVGVAFLVGQLIYRTKVDILWTTIIAIAIIFFAIWLGGVLPIKGSFTTMAIAVLIFAYFSAILPVWRFIQPFNYASVYVVYFGIIFGIIGLLIGHKPLTLPAFTSWSIGIGPLWPLLFVTIACGCISGWHSLVSSTATSRQIETELDARPVAGGAMFAEFTIAIIATLVCATAFSGSAEYLKALKNPIGIFTTGLGSAITTVGFPASYATTVAAAMISILLLTVLNLVVRFMKVATVELLGDKISIAKNVHVATIAALILAYILIVTGTWQFIWVLFGGANQLMAGLALLLVTLFLASKARNYTVAIIPMFFMYATTVAALIYTSCFKLLPAAFAGKVAGFKLAGNYIGAGIAILLVIIALILIYDGMKAFARYRAGEVPAEAEKAPA